MTKSVNKEAGEFSKKLPNDVRFAYDPKRDIQPVDQTGFFDLREAYLTHSLPGNVVMDAETYNGVVDPASLLGKSSDVFDAMRKAQYVQAHKSDGKSGDAPASPGASAE